MCSENVFFWPNQGCNFSLDCWHFQHMCWHMRPSPTPHELPWDSHGGPKGPHGPQRPKTLIFLKFNSHFPAKSAKIIVLSSIFGPHGTLIRIQRIFRIHRKRNISGRTDPGFPTPGAKMTVVFTNSLKLLMQLSFGTMDKTTHEQLK